MAKKKSSAILADENRNFFLKRGNREKFGRSQRNFSETGGNLKQGGKCIIASGGMDAPAKRRLI